MMASVRGWMIVVPVLSLCVSVVPARGQVQPAMGDPLPGLTPEQLERFFTGREAFEHVMVAEVGLGPIFNQDSCGSCHINPIGGSGTLVVTRFGSSGKGGFDPLEDLGGSLLQAEAISPECMEEVPPSAGVTAHRLTNSTLGFGLVEAIEDADIEFYQNNPPSGDVSGVVHMVEAFEDPGVPRVGRFGWKCQIPTVLTFSSDAALNEMGITNRFLMEENDPNGVDPPDLEDCDTIPDPEDNESAPFNQDPDSGEFIGEFIDRVTDFQRFLSPPPQTPKAGMTGEGLFVAIGCADCHVPNFMTLDDANLEDAIRNKMLHPYSDFLLHDMGLAADFIGQGDAQVRELRAAPLWGLRVRDPMWHDGRVAAGTFASRIMAAVACHCGLLSEAKPSAERFMSGAVAACPDSTTMPGTGFECNPGDVPGGLDDAGREALIAFLDSLGRREFDYDGDNLVQLFDFFDLLTCSMTDDVITPDHPCAVHDVNQDMLVDQSDFELFMTVYDGPRGDCDCDGFVDLQDIFSGDPDANQNGIPDACEPTCPQDLDCTMAVGVEDLLALLAAWGHCPGGITPCAADLDSDGAVGVTDLLALIAAWGSCN